VLAQLLAKSPSGRFADAHQAADALQATLATWLARGVEA
jgi:hypothetical protein